MGMKSKQRITRVLLIPLLFLVAIPFSLLTSDLAQAATPVSSASTPDRQALSYWYYGAIKACFKAANGSASVPVETDSSKIDSGSLFTRAVLVGANVYGQYPKAVVDSADDGVMDCTDNDNQLSKKALSFWGLTGPELLCGMGYKRENGQSCAGAGSTNNFTQTISNPDTAFASFLKSKIYGGSDPGTLSAPAKYSYYSGSLIAACTTGKGSATRPTDASASAIYALKSSVDTKGVVQYTYYNATGDHTSNWNGVYLDPGSSATSTCKATLNLANNSFPAYASASACSTNVTISANDSYLAACIAGAGNKSNIGFCAATYPDGFTGSADHGSVVDNKTTRQACYAGQGNGAADDCINAAGYSSALLTACINGSNHASDATYCATTYPAPEALNPNKPTTDTNKDARNACIKGQGYSVLPLDTAIQNASDCTTNPQAAGCKDSDTGSGSCVIEGIGWMICPVFNFLAGVADSTYGIVQSLLITDVKVVSTDSGTYRAWSVMRTFANVGFVIVFLIIIFSQLTGVGVSNYGVKKLLPRIIIAAILVNISFFFTQIAVDISNILGGSLKSLLDNINTSSGTAANDVWSTGNTFTQVAAGIFGGQLALTGIAVAGAAAYFGGAGLLIPILLAAVLAIIITLFILIARQAFIILLVVLSPLAFLAMLLPNTETYFKQWRKMFVALLLVYPMIALLFGASHLASGILLEAFSKTNNLLGQLVALAVMVLPLFVVPTLVKGSLNAIPFAGKLASNWASRANGAIGKNAKQSFTRSTFGRSLGIRRQAKENYRAGKFAEGVSKSGSVANFLAKEPGILPSQRAANKAVDRVAIAAAEKADTEEVSAAEILLRSHHSDPTALIKASGAEFRSAVAAGDSVRARAAQNILLNSGGAGINELHSAVDDSFGEGKTAKDSVVGNNVRAALNRAGLKPKNNTLASWAYNGDSFEKTAESATTYSKLSDAELGGQSKQNLVGAYKSGVLTQERAKQVLANPVVFANMGEEEKVIVREIAEKNTYTPNPGDPGFTGPQNNPNPDADLSVPHSN
jgi:hypothetical protein